MPKEILIYGHINSFSASDFINEVNEMSDNEELIVRINSEGGSPEATFGMISKFQEFKGKKSIKVDGKALSMGLFFLAYSENVEALDVSTFLLHRAAFPSWIESSESFDNGLSTFLANINKSLRKAIEAKMDVEKFEKITGTTLNEVFSMDGQKNVILTAQQAKSIGLVDKINKITPKVQASIDDRLVAIAAKYTPEANNPTPQTKESINNNSHKKSKMTLKELKAEHPALAAELIAEGEAKAKATETDRVGAWLKFNEVDPKAVAEGIESGKDLSQTAMADFSIKMMSKKTIKDVEAEGAEGVDTKKPEGEKTELETMEAKLDKELGLNSVK